MKRERYEEAARRIGVPRGTLRSLVHRRQIPHIRISRRMVLFDVAEIEAWIATRTVEACAAAPAPAPAAAASTVTENNLDASPSGTSSSDSIEPRLHPPRRP